jgi:hypothetical protein
MCLQLTTTASMAASWCLTTATGIRPVTTATRVTTEPLFPWPPPRLRHQPLEHTPVTCSTAALRPQRRRWRQLPPFPLRLFPWRTLCATRCTTNPTRKLITAQPFGVVCLGADVFLRFLIAFNAIPAAPCMRNQSHQAASHTDRRCLINPAQTWGVRRRFVCRAGISLLFLLCLPFSSDPCGDLT